MAPRMPVHCRTRRYLVPDPLLVHADWRMTAPRFAASAPDMGKLLKIQLDFARLRKNLSREESRPLTDDEVHRWLLDAGLTPKGDWWVVRERDLGQVDPSEVLAVEDVEDT